MKYPEQSNSERQKVEGWVPGAGRGGNEAYLMGIEFQFYKMKRVLEMEGGDGCTTS